MQLFFAYFLALFIGFNIIYFAFLSINFNSIGSLLFSIIWFIVICLVFDSNILSNSNDNDEIYEE